MAARAGYGFEPSAASAFRPPFGRSSNVVRNRGSRGAQVLLPGGRRPAQRTLGVHAGGVAPPGRARAAARPAPSPAGTGDAASPARARPSGDLLRPRQRAERERHAVERRLRAASPRSSAGPTARARRPSERRRPRTRAGAGARASRRGPRPRRRRRTGRSGARWRCARGTPPAAAGPRAPRAARPGPPSRSPRQLVGLLERVRHQRLVRLLGVPRAAAGRAQPVHHAHERAQGVRLRRGHFAVGVGVGRRGRLGLAGRRLRRASRRGRTTIHGAGDGLGDLVAVLQRARTAG